MNRWMRALLFSCCVMPTAMAAPARQAGQALFVHGDVQVVHADASREPLRQGGLVHVGDRIAAGNGAHVQITFSDGAFVSLRAGGTLQVRDYLVSPDSPAGHRIQLQLDQGVARFITGRAGEANKQAFRLNTPLAAIGIRGTDFVVEAGADAVRALVHRGAIVMAPFSADCLQDALGACGGASARQLTGSQQDAFLEMRPHAAPVLRSLRDAAAPPALREQPRSEPPVRGLPESPRAGDTVRADNIEWGRWTQASDAALLQAGLERVGRNDVFALYRRAEEISLPAVGQFSLVPTYTEAYAVTATGERLPAALQNPELTLDFGRQVFATRVLWQHGSMSLPFNAAGRIDATGLLKADPAQGNMHDFYGVLSSKGTSAAYIFEGDAGSATRAVGLVRWLRLPGQD